MFLLYQVGSLVKLKLISLIPWRVYQCLGVTLKRWLTPKIWSTPLLSKKHQKVYFDQQTASRHNKYGHNEGTAILIIVFLIYILVLL